MELKLATRGSALALRQAASVQEALGTRRRTVDLVEVETTGDSVRDEPRGDVITVTARRARQHGTDLLVALRDEGLTVTGFNVRAPTLDDVFLAITGEHVDLDAEAASDGVGGGMEVTE